MATKNKAGSKFGAASPAYKKGVNAYRASHPVAKDTMKSKRAAHNAGLTAAGISGSARASMGGGGG